MCMRCRIKKIISHIKTPRKYAEQFFTTFKWDDSFVVAFNFRYLRSKKKRAPREITSNILPFFIVVVLHCRNIFVAQVLWQGSWAGSPAK